MTEDDTALLTAMNDLIATGHTFTFRPVMGHVTGTVLGPLGNHQATAPDLRHAVESLIVQLIAARLSGPADDRPDDLSHLKACSQASVNPGVFDDLGPDSYF